MKQFLSIIMFFQSGITTKLLISINLISIIIFASLGITVINNTSTSLTKLMNSKISSVRKFLGEINSLNVINKFKDEIEPSANMALKDIDFGYVGFFDKKKQVIFEKYDDLATKDSLLFSEEPIIDSESKDKEIAGYVVIGQNPKRINLEVNQITTLILSIIIGAQIFLSIFLITLARSISKPLISSSNNLKEKEKELEQISKHLMSSGKELASSSNKQVVATQEGVAAMEEMKSMISKTNNFITNSNKITQEVKNSTDQGNLIITELVSSMKLILESNNQLLDISTIISDISSKTKTINDIVLKTQLLSFNASIEAAKAGQHGKGFAIVAEEIGSLAKISGTAATEIGSLLDTGEKQVEHIIQSIGSKISKGETITNAAAELFQNVSSKITKVNDHISQIASASHEQFTGVNKSSEALYLIDQLARNTTKISQTSVSYSEQLTELNTHIKETMNSLDKVIVGSQN